MLFKKNEKEKVRTWMHARFLKRQVGVEESVESVGKKRAGFMIELLLGNLQERKGEESSVVINL